MNKQVKTIGIIGGGQLGLMLANATHRLGLNVVILEKSIYCPAYSVLQLEKDTFVSGELSCYDKLLELANVSDVLTFEIEHIDTKLLLRLEQETGKIIYPNPRILEIIQDKFAQKTFLKKVGLPVGKFELIRSIKNIDKLARQFGFPMMIKSRKGGYDGGGNFVVKSKSDWNFLITKLELIKKHKDYFVEKFVSFEHEVSALVARDVSSIVSIYPIIDTFQENNVCRKTVVPSTLSPEIQQKAQLIGTEIANKFDYIGIMAVEMFVLSSGEILINEIAPRVHNSGHWTIDGSQTSQFEQHIRCITGMKLGSIQNKSPCCLMYNVFGDNIKIFDKLKSKQMPKVCFYDYNKKEVRSNRKMGHINIVGDCKEEVDQILQSLAVNQS